MCVCVYTKSNMEFDVEWAIIEWGGGLLMQVSNI